MSGKGPTRHRTPDDDPEPGTPSTGEEVCPECHGTGKQVGKKLEIENGNLRLTKEGKLFADGIAADLFFA